MPVVREPIVGVRARVGSFHCNGSQRAGHASEGHIDEVAFTVGLDTMNRLSHSRR
jgi:hypothetical protein